MVGADAPTCSWGGSLGGICWVWDCSRTATEKPQTGVCLGRGIRVPEHTRFSWRNKFQGSQVFFLTHQQLTLMKGRTTESVFPRCILSSLAEASPSIHVRGCYPKQPHYLEVGPSAKDCARKAAEMMISTVSHY